MVARAALPTRYGRFTIYGFKGRDPQEEAVALFEALERKNRSPGARPLAVPDWRRSRVSSV